MACHRFKGRTYNTCVKVSLVGKDDTKAWCSTEVNSKTEHILGKEDECADECAISDCPIGFYWAATEGTCYQVHTLLECIAFHCMSI